MNPNEMAVARLRMLDELYKAVGGDIYSFADMLAIGEALGYETSLAEKLIQQLQSFDLVKVAGLGSWKCALTPAGLRELEQLYSNPKGASPHFPASVVGIVIHGDVTNSQIQQSSPGSIQASMPAGLRGEDLKNFLMVLRTSLEKMQINPEQEAVVKSDADTIEAQLKSPKPKVSIINESLQSIRTILEGAAGAVVAAELLKLMGMGH